MCMGRLPSYQPGPTTTTGNGDVDDSSNNIHDDEDDDDGNDQAEHINADEREYEQQTRVEYTVQNTAGLFQSSAG